MWVRAFVLAAGLGLAALSTGDAAAAPVGSAPGLSTENGVEQAQWHHRRRCWWETRRFRDHRGRWQTRRVQVCRR
ncbi:hypothetical protein [Bosea sp. 124]|uniref:hypothetical protein n=1 Tax=Bosea sp. 124 TaxID=2135642 RepID=UPI000D381D90|nr:hypothetical protein [Bosea sp. 124]PTM39608.1 hypothetical protein C8D03_1113 [Bosea sp. 124]